MALTRPAFANRQALRRRKVALLMRLRQNLWLKGISLLASILLFIYVQQERNPTASRDMIVPIVKENLRPDVEVETDLQQIGVTVSGPRPIVDALKDGSIHVVADLRTIQNDKLETKSVRLRYDVKNIPEEMKQQLTFDPSPLLLPRLQVQVYPEQVRQMPIEAHFSKEASAGYRYGRPEVRPSYVKVAGRLDRLSHIDRIVVNAAPIEPGTPIDGDFPVSARDMANNPIEGVTITPPTAHVTVPLENEPYTKIVPVSPSIVDQPLPSYKLADIIVSPNRVRIVGRPDKIDQISTLETEDISVHDQMENQTISVKLRVPDGIEVQDLEKHPLTKVSVQISVRKATPSSPPTPPSGKNDPSNTNPPPNTANTGSNSPSN